MPAMLRRVMLPLLCCVAGVAGVAAVQLVAANRASYTAIESADTPTTHYPEWLRPCTAPGVNSPALCGTYEVWENRTSRAGRRVGLHVLVLPARGPERKPDPVFYLAGGPGGGASAGAQLVANVLARAHQQRDLVFVDARGTGRSQPLDCPLPGRNAAAQDFFGTWLDAEHVRSCRARQAADVAHYHTAVIVDDLEEVRDALDYERINLFGISGGTRTAQIYLKRHPRSIRAAVLKGVVSLDFEMPLPFARALEHGMRGIITACAAEPACNAAYPELDADWKRAQRRFEQGPVSATVRHPFTGQQEQVRIERGVFADALRHLLYSTQQSRRVPGLIHAAARGDLDDFAQRELTRTIELHAQIADGVFFSTTCVEDLPFVTEDDLRRATAGTFLGDYRVRLQLAACAIWLPGVRADAARQEPVRVATPVLLISGEFDTATPPDEAERVARHLPNRRHIVFPNQSHDFANPMCEGGLITSFFDGLQPDRHDVACVATTRRPPFIVPATQ